MELVLLCRPSELSEPLEDAEEFWLVALQGRLGGLPPRGLTLRGLLLLGLLPFLGDGQAQSARGELDRLEGPGYAARRTELRRKAKEAARTRDRQAAASQDEAEESDATEEEVTRGRTTRVGRPRGGMKVAARSGERLRREIGRGRLPRVGDG